MINPKYENKMVIREEAFDEDGNVVGVKAEIVPIEDKDWIESDPILVNSSDKFKEGYMDVRYYNDDNTHPVPDKKDTDENS